MAKRQHQEKKISAPASCPVCGSVVDAEGETFPFCSRRCRLVDLNRWLGGDYRISRPIEASDLEEGVD